MADQQFLASFGVDIDESGVSRLQKILVENRTLAESLSASFDAASESVKTFRESISEDFPTLFSASGYGNVTENEVTVPAVPKRGGGSFASGRLPFPVSGEHPRKGTVYVTCRGGAAAGHGSAGNS